MIAPDGTILPNGLRKLLPKPSFQNQSGIKTEKLSQRLIKSSQEEEYNVYQLPFLRRQHDFVSLANSHEDFFNYGIDDNKIIGDEAKIVRSNNGMQQTEADEQFSSSEYQCKQSDKTFPTASSLWHHNKGKHDPDVEIVQCPHCNYKTRRKSNLQNHILGVHEGEMIQCIHCDFKTRRKSSLQQHIQAVHAEPTLQCPKCDYKASMKYNIKRHIQAKHEGPTLFPCSQCDFISKSPPNLRKHVNAIHKGEIFTCPHCDYSSVQNGCVKRHILTVHVGQTFSCPLCGETRKQKRSIQNHMQKVHKDNTTEVISDQCDLTYNTELNSIKSSHTNEIYKCPYCSYLAAREHDIQSHITTEHDINSGALISKEIMEKIFQNNDENIEQQLLDPESCDIIVSFS